MSGDGVDRLAPYRAKRSFDRTPEPPGTGAPPQDGALPRYVIQKHDARRLHYDFRLEADGVLVSWAVPKGPSLDPKVKRLAVHVEDHPLDYESFEGVIPGAQYGSGTVIVWDAGTYRNTTERRGQPLDVAGAVRAGHLSVWLEGAKLRGGWSLTRTGGDKSWLLVKKADEHAEPGRDVTEDEPDSVVSGRGLREVAADEGAATWSSERAAWQPVMLAQTLDPGQLRTVRGEDWRFERKLDGLRCVAVRNGADVELWSRNHLTFTPRFPDVVAALAALPAANFVLDGELVAHDGSFGSLQRGEPATFRAFDLLHLLGRDTTALPLDARSALLAQALEGGNDVVAAVEALDGDPDELLARASAEGWEGLVAKRSSSAYRAGRSPEWRKIKLTASQELVVVGWTEPSGSRHGFGALLVGYWDDGGLRYAGKVGTGFDHRTLSSLAARLAGLEVPDPPVLDRVRERGAHWVRPELVAAVRFTEWTAEGRLRHPSFLGLREDKPASEVRRER